jgi:hypothetical protein
MTPKKALELVTRYAQLNRDIKLKTQLIGERLSQCKGLSGKRSTQFNASLELINPEIDEKGREKDLHIWHWYRPMEKTHAWNSLSWQDIDPDEHGAECAHCYGAHLLIQDRKRHRRDLGHVKRAMSRTGGAS